MPTIFPIDNDPFYNQANAQKDEKTLVEINVEHVDNFDKKSEKLLILESDDDDEVHKIKILETGSD